MDHIVKLSGAKTQSKAVPAPDRQQMAEHVASVSFELSEMAAKAEMPFLKHLLDMTTEEAVQQGYMARRCCTDRPRKATACQLPSLGPCRPEHAFLIDASL